MLNETSLNTVCGALCYAMGVQPPEHAAAPNEKMVKYVDETPCARYPYIETL